MAAQLLVYGFGPDAEFEGHLVGALERLESGGALRVLDALFLRRDGDTGELSAIALTGDSAGLAGPLLDFRLDDRARRRATEGALTDGVRELGDALEPGTGIGAVVVEHAWLGVLEDAVARTGGRRLDSRFVDATKLAQLVPELVAAQPSRSENRG
jgi:hypothetical protein